MRQAEGIKGVAPINDMAGGDFLAVLKNAFCSSELAMNNKWL